MGDGIPKPAPAIGTGPGSSSADETLADSKAHWERDTLIIDTTNFTDNSRQPDGHGPQVSV
jgi:hypothetical protein